ncbi:hypothetical protein AcW1_001454 [Taiwanofungus camphoratus]|nr:hypothetical protein AcV5_005381 [Antrodia cinnamomea]KAI0964688.1 hypothetical protein AcW1_001454 [Antrodia cinnamomea]
MRLTCQDKFIFNSIFWSFFQSPTAHHFILCSISTSYFSIQLSTFSFSVEALTETVTGVHHIGRRLFWADVHTQNRRPAFLFSLISFKGDKTSAGAVQIRIFIRQMRKVLMYIPCWSMLCMMQMCSHVVCQSVRRAT